MSLCDSICRELDAGRDMAAVSVVEQSASSPRHAGAVMLVGQDGLVDGTVGGGILEAEAIETGKRVVQTRRAEFLEIDLTGRDASVSGMICGGKMRLFVEPLVSDNPTRVLFQRLRIGCGVGDEMFSVVPVKAPGQRRLCRTKAVEWPLPPELRDSIRERIRLDGLHSPVLLKTSDGLEFVIEPWSVPARLILAGGGHVSMATARLASFVGFSVSVIDDREEFSSSARFPQAACTRVVPEYEHCFDGFAIDEKTSIAIMTRGHLFDRKVLQQALQTSAGYIGMIGSTRKTAAVFAKLKEDGITDDALSRVVAPIGLAIGAETPEEIAVSILAQLIAVRARRTGASHHLDSAWH